MEFMRKFGRAEHERFLHTLRLVGVRNEVARDDLWTKTRKAYAEDHRSYHDAGHIIDCLEQLDKVSELLIEATQAQFLTQPAIVVSAFELALWWHDIIYRTALPKHGISDEEASASWAFAKLYIQEVYEPVLSTVYKMISATDHKGKPTELRTYHPLTDWIVDIDLSILGADIERIDMYETQIECEYTRYVRHKYYVRGRLQFLRTFLSERRERGIYRTVTFRDMYEDRAQQNLRRLMKKLEAEEAELWT